MSIQVEPPRTWSKFTPAVVIGVLALIALVLAVAWRWIIFVLILLAFGAGIWIAHS